MKTLVDAAVKGLYICAIISVFSDGLVKLVRPEESIDKNVSITLPLMDTDHTTCITLPSLSQHLIVNWYSLLINTPHSTDVNLVVEGLGFMCQPVGAARQVVTTLVKRPDYNDCEDCGLHKRCAYSTEKTTSDGQQQCVYKCPCSKDGCILFTMNIVPQMYTDDVVTICRLGLE